MTDEEKRAEAAKKKREYRIRKKAEELARQAPKEELTALFNEQFHQAIIPTDKSNLHELEKQWISAKGDSQIRPFPPGVLYQDNHKDELADMLAASEERGRRTALIMSMYERDAASTNKLLWHILENIILMRLELTDMIGGLRK